MHLRNRGATAKKCNRNFSAGANSVFPSGGGCVRAIWGLLLLLCSPYSSPNPVKFPEALVPLVNFPVRRCREPQMDTHPSVCRSGEIDTGIASVYFPPSPSPSLSLSTPRPLLQSCLLHSLGCVPEHEQCLISLLTSPNKVGRLP